MNLSELARDQLARATARERDARAAFREARRADAYRYGQEALEMGLKALLRAFGIEVPKRHDVGPALDEVRAILPAWFVNDVPAIQRLSFEMASRRSLAMYGEERTGTAASELFADAHEIDHQLGLVAHVLRGIRRLLAPNAPHPTPRARRRRRLRPIHPSSMSLRPEGSRRLTGQRANALSRETGSDV